MQHQPIEFSILIRNWQAISRRPDQAPLKAAFNPSKVARLLPYLYIVERENLSERDETGGLVVRLLGSELQETVGNSAFDESVFDAMLRRDWRFYERFVGSCGRQVCAGRLFRSVRLHDGLCKIIETLHVPLADKAGVARFMLGVMTVRPGQDGSFAEEMGPPKGAKLNYRYVDLGYGVPAQHGATTVIPVDDFRCPESVVRH